MARHHNKKYGYGVTSARNGRVHQRMAQRRLAKQGMPAPMAIGMSKFGMAPLGLIGELSSVNINRNRSTTWTNPYSI